MYCGGRKKNFSSEGEGKPCVRVVLIKALICITAARSNISAVPEKTLVSLLLLGKARGGMMFQIFWEQ